MNVQRTVQGLVGLGVIVLLIAACAPAVTPTPVIIEKIKEVPKEVTKEVVKEVPKEVIKVVTPTPAPTATRKPDQVVTITWWGTERGRDTAATREMHFKLARAYETKNPNIRIAVSLFPSRGFATRVLTALAAGQGPDIWYHYWATDFATQGHLEDLTPYIQASKIDPAKRWFPIGNMRAVYEGKYYGVPRDATAGVIAYNKDLFDAAGVAYPKEGWTIQDFRKIAIALTDPKKDQYGIDAIVGSVGCFQWSSFSYNMGAELVSPDGRKVVGYMDSPAGINALKFCLDLSAVDKVAPPAALQDQFGELVFLSGKVAMQHISTWELPALREQAKFKWAVVAPPRFDEKTEGIAWTDSYVFYLSKKSQNKPEAWQFLEWLTGPEAGKMMADIYTPALPSVWEELKWPSDPILGVFWKELQKPARVPNYLRSQYFSECVAPALDNIWSRYVVKGERNLEAIVKEHTATAQTCLDKNYATLGK